MKIIYCGALWEGGTCRMRMNALKRLGHTLCAIDSTHVTSLRDKLAGKLTRSVGWWLDHAGVNDSLIAVAAREAPDVVWIDNGQAIRQTTLKCIRQAAKNARIIHYSPDDMMARHNQSIQFLNSLEEYDLHATTKTYNVRELRSLGAKNAVFVNNAYCPEVHKPMSVSQSQKIYLGDDVGFIGAYEEDRADSMLALAEAGIRVRVWGGWCGARQWKKRRYSHPNLRIENRGLFGVKYAEALCSFDVNLGFLRKINRDQQTTRSIEIPACGAFLLAERSEEHCRLFDEGREAEFFSNTTELIDKCRYYLHNKEKRISIAAAGRARCISSRYSYDEHVSAILRALKQ